MKVGTSVTREASGRGKSTCLLTSSALVLGILLFASAIPIPNSIAQSSSTIIINEVELNPPGNDNYLTVIEQIELFNPTSSVMDIGGWTVNALGGTSQETISIDLGTTIPAGGYWIVGRGSQWLDNAAETVVLKDPNGVEIASAGPFDDDVNDGHSWQRYPNGGDSWAFRTSTLGASNGAPSQQNIRPSASAGPDLIVNEGKSVTLDGSGSSDSDGSIVSYSWTQISGPPVVALTGVNSQNPTFAAPTVASDSTLTFKLTVTDNNGASGEDTVNIVVKNVNVAPTANAGPDQQVNEGNIVILDGSSSLDPDGTIAAYAWSQVLGPSVTLSSMSEQKRTFTAPAVSVDTTLTFRLVVTDNDGSTSSADTVSILIKDVVATTVNHTPTANAGPDQTQNENALVTLTGTSSSDADTGDTLTYSWTQTLGPSVTLSSTSAQKPSFMAPQVVADTDLVFQLIVTDNHGAKSAPDTDDILVKNVNHPPLANAGADQVQNELATVTLDGTGSADSDSSVVSYQWTQTAGPSVTLNDGRAAQPTFTAPSVTVESTLRFRLIVIDNDGTASSSDFVNIVIKDVPSVDTTAPVVTIPSSLTVEATGSLGAVITFAAAANDNVDGSLIPSCTQTSGSTFPIAPTTVTCKATDAAGNTASASFTVTVRDTTSPALVVPSSMRIKAIDYSGAAVSYTATATDLVDVSRPVTCSPASGTIFPVGTSTVSCSASDSRGNAVTKVFSVTVIAPVPTDTTAPSVTSSPLGGSYSSAVFVTLKSNEPATIYYTTSGSTPSASSPQYAGPIPISASTTLRYFAKDIAGNSSPVQEQEYVISLPSTPNTPPIANAGADFVVGESTTGVQLQGSGADSGSVISYSWEQLVGPTVNLSSVNTATAAFDAPSVVVNTDLTFKLTVTDNDDESNSDIVAVTVKNVNQAPIAHAGTDQSVNAGTLVSLDGSSSFDADNGPASLTYIWAQTFGTQVTLSDATIAKPSFIAPEAGPTGDTLVFELRVTDGETPKTDSVNIMVNPVATDLTEPLSQLSPSLIPNETQSEGSEIDSEIDTDSYPISITDLQVNDRGSGQFSITTTFNNYGPDSLLFTALIEVRDSDSVTILLQFIKGTLYVGQSLELGTTWNPPKAGSYEVRSFAVSDLENPQILSVVMSKPVTINESSLTEPVPSNIQTVGQCDESLWQHVYNPQRLKVIDDCFSVTGTIEDIRAEADGDYHVLVRLDSEFESLVNAANREQNGDLVVEPVCQKSVTQEDAVAACLSYSNHISIPPVGSHVRVTGSYVLDLEHGGWAEIHPATSIMVEQEGAIGSTQPAEPTNRDNGQGELFVTVSVAADPITRGSIQVITVTVMDASSSERVKEATVSGTVDYASGSTHKSFAGTTNDNGQLTYTWRIGGSSTPGTFFVHVEVSAGSYQHATATGSFEVTPAT